MADDVKTTRGAAVLDIRRNKGALDFILSVKGEPRPCEYNAVQAIDAAQEFSGLHFDVFLGRMRLGEDDLSDHHEREALVWLQKTYRVAFTLAHVRNAMASVAYSRKRDSLLEFFDSLPAWDRTPRIELAFEEGWGSLSTPIIRAASRNLFIAIVARGKRPGCQCDTLWVFEGPQGSGKSSALRALGGKWHCEVTAPIGSPDFMREMRGVSIAELSEMDSFRGREAGTAKRALSATTDRLIEKYEKHAVSYPRRAVTVGTTNEKSYWHDSTGARRLIPIPTGEIDLALIEANREQWFAEAIYLFDAGADWWTFPEEIKDEQEGRQEIDPWEDSLRGLMSNGLRGVSWPSGWISSAALMADWLKLESHQQGPVSGVRLGRVMRRLGFESKKRGGGERGWQPAGTREGSDA